MDRFLEQTGSRSLISRLSIVEFESVLAMKIRTGEIDQTALQIARRRFRADLARQRLIVAPPVHEGHFQSARKLLVQYGVVEGLRTLDALQLAIALDLHRLEHIAVLVAVRQTKGFAAYPPWRVVPRSTPNSQVQSRSEHCLALKPVLR